MVQPGTSRVREEESAANLTLGNGTLDAASLSLSLLLQL